MEVRDHQNDTPGELIVDEQVVEEYKNFRENDRMYIETPWSWWRVPVTYDFVPFTRHETLFRFVRGLMMLMMGVFFAQNLYHERARSLHRKITK